MFLEPCCFPAGDRQKTPGQQSPRRFLMQGNKGGWDGHCFGIVVSECFQRLFMCIIDQPLEIVTMVCPRKLSEFHLPITFGWGRCFNCFTIYSWPLPPGFRSVAWNTIYGPFCIVRQTSFNISMILHDQAFQYTAIDLGYFPTNAPMNCQELLQMIDQFDSLAWCEAHLLESVKS